MVATVSTGDKAQAHATPCNAWCCQAPSYELGHKTTKMDGCVCSTSFSTVDVNWPTSLYAKCPTADSSSTTMPRRSCSESGCSEFLMQSDATRTGQVRQLRLIT